MITMFKLQVMLFALTSLALFAAAQSDPPLHYSIGMSLSLGHGTVSVYNFKDADQVYIDIAKIEGGAEYKHFMKTYLPTDGERHSVDTEALSQSFFPSWTSLSKQPPVTKMLKALKTAAEAFVEGTVKEVAIVLPYDIDETFYHHMKATARLADLDAVMRRRTPTAAGAAIAQGFFDHCYMTDVLVLAIDYSREGLTAQLMVNECRVHASVNWLYSTDLRPGSAKQEDLVTKLERLITYPDETEMAEWEVEDRNSARVSLSGEAAHDETLRSALESLSPTNGTSLISLELPPVNIATTPTTFAAAQFAAWLMDIINEPSVGTVDV